MKHKSTTDLHHSLYIEHLEELSALYERWLWMMGNPGFNGFTFMDSQRRIDGHLDALTQSGSASALCVKLIMEGDFGVCYGAARVLLRQSRHDELLNLIFVIEPSDEKRLQGVVDALCHEPTRLLPNNALDILLKKDACRARIASRIMAFHRIDAVDDLYKAMDTFHADQSVILDILHAIGRLRPSHGAARLLDFLRHTNADVVEKTLETLVRIGDHGVLKKAMSMIEPRKWPPITLGLYGDKDAVTDVLFAESRGDLSPECMIAAGLIGDLSYISNLMHWLSDPLLSEHAALALSWITGLSLYEDHFVPDVTCEDDLFENEKEAWRNGTLYPDGKIPGRMVTRLSQNPDAWSAGLRQSSIPFDPDKRYRSGKPYSRSCLYGLLKDNRSPDFIRQLACDEWVIRHGEDIRFETRMTARQQGQAIESHRPLIEKSASSFMDGAWYFQGKLMNKERSSRKDT